MKVGKGVMDDNDVSVFFQWLNTSLVRMVV
jgi:hypothetical protein